MQWFTKITTKEITMYGLFLAFAMAASYVEVLIPIPLGIPGIKLGLANCAVVLCLYLFGAAPALMLNILRVILCSFLFANLYGLWYSLAGAAASFAVMILFSRFKSMTMVGVSIMGGVFHNLGQLFLALLITEVPVLLYYIPVLVIAGVVTGLINGGLSKVLYERLRKVRS